MMTLLEFKEKLRQTYTRNEIYINAALKFLAVLIALCAIGNKIGYMSALKSIPVMLIISLISAFLPSGLILIIVCGIIVAHLYALSLELSVIVLLILLIMFLIYFRFSPNDSIVLILTPVLFILKIPYLVPVCLGLVSTPLSIVSTAFGVVLSFVMEYASQNSAAISNFSSEEVVDKINYIVTNMLGNKEMYLYIVAFAIVLLAVYAIRRMSVNYSWQIAILCGGIINLIIFIIGIIAFNISTVSIGMLILGTLLSMLISYIVNFFVFSVDYSRTEHTQFEDDDYYYYVKAVPKVSIAAPKVNVKKINAGKAKRHKARR